MERLEDQVASSLIPLTQESPRPCENHPRRINPIRRKKSSPVGIVISRWGTAKNPSTCSGGCIQRSSQQLYQSGRCRPSMARVWTIRALKLLGVNGSPSKGGACECGGCVPPHNNNRLPREYLGRERCEKICFCVEHTHTIRTRDQA